MLKLIKNDTHSIFIILEKEYPRYLALCLAEYITKYHPYYDYDYYDDFSEIFWGFKDFYMAYKLELEEQSECESYYFYEYKKCVSALIDFNEEDFLNGKHQRIFNKIYFNQSNQIDRKHLLLADKVNRFSNPSNFLKLGRIRASEVLRSK